MEPESPDNERQRKIDEAIESGNHELREMARLAYNRGDKDLARNIWRSLTESQDSESEASGERRVQNAPVPPAVVSDPDLEAARRAEEASQNAVHGSAFAVYASNESKADQANGAGNPDPATGSDAMTSSNSIDNAGSAEIVNPAQPGLEML